MAIWSSRLKKTSSKNKSSQSEIIAKPVINPYHCVEIKAPYDACEEMLKLHGRRFLSAEAPILPLPSCNQPCACKFKHHNDRRYDDRRDVFNSSVIHYNGEKNRRLGEDRRSNSTVKIGFR